jgi:hypothetical protein
MNTIIFNNFFHCIIRHPMNWSYSENTIHLDFFFDFLFSKDTIQWPWIMVDCNNLSSRQLSYFLKDEQMLQMGDHVYWFVLGIKIQKKKSSMLWFHFQNSEFIITMITFIRKPIYLNYSVCNWQTPKRNNPYLPFLKQYTAKYRYFSGKLSISLVRYGIRKTQC